MPVDRVRRDAVADALASFLRHEMTRDTLAAVLQRIAPRKEAEGEGRSEKDAYLDGLLELWSLDMDYGTITEERWTHLCRHLAFLKTDLERRQGHDFSGEDDLGPREILLARWHTLVLLLAFGVAYFTSWWIFAAATVVSFLLFQVRMWRRDSQINAETKRQLERELEYHPFADHHEWLAHKYIVDKYNLPAYDASAFEDPAPVNPWPWFMPVPIRWAFYLVIAAMFLWMYLFTIFMWPLFLILIVIPRREARRQK